MIPVPAFPVGATLSQADLATLARAVRELQTLAIERVEAPLSRTFTTLSAPGLGLSSGLALTVSGQSGDTGWRNSTLYPQWATFNAKSVYLMGANTHDNVAIVQDMIVGVGHFYVWWCPATSAIPWYSTGSYAMPAATPAACWVMTFYDPRFVMDMPNSWKLNNFQFFWAFGPTAGQTPAGAWSLYHGPGGGNWMAKGGGTVA